MPSGLLNLLALALAVYGGLLVLVWAMQERIVFQPPPWAAGGAGSADRVHYTADDGAALFAYVLPGGGPGAPVLLAFHGNADLARWVVPWGRHAARELAATVVIPEFRGYDGIPGRPSYQAAARDARAALRYVRDTMGVPPERIVMFGHSLGSAVAAELAAHTPPRALALQSPFTSARAMARRMVIPGLYWIYPLLARVHYDTRTRVAALDVPVWVVHGERDFVIPARMGREVFQAAAVKGELLAIPGAGHNDVAELGGDAYWEWLRRAVHPAHGPAPATTPVARE